MNCYQPYLDDNAITLDYRTKSQRSGGGAEWEREGKAVVFILAF